MNMGLYYLFVIAMIISALLHLQSYRLIRKLKEDVENYTQSRKEDQP